MSLFVFTLFLPYAIFYVHREAIYIKKEDILNVESFSFGFQKY